MPGITSPPSLHSSVYLSQFAFASPSLPFSDRTPHSLKIKALLPMQFSFHPTGITTHFFISSGHSPHPDGAPVNLSNHLTWQSPWSHPVVAAVSPLIGSNRYPRPPKCFSTSGKAPRSRSKAFSLSWNTTMEPGRA